MCGVCVLVISKQSTQLQCNHTHNIRNNNATQQTTTTKQTGHAIQTQHKQTQQQHKQTNGQRNNKQHTNKINDNQTKAGFNESLISINQTKHNNIQHTQHVQQALVIKH